ncbi:MAG: MBL fold metallo-hydrolase [Planctomycetota bacterium]|nr:MBL fold metallo-hydrolase [Planctomycetota bacterium]
MTTWNASLLRCGSFRLDAGCMFGLIPRVVWSRWFPPGVIDDLNRMPLQQNSLLLESAGTLVVIEAGIGDKMTPKEHAMYAQERQPTGAVGAGRPRTIVDALHEAGARPADVSAVILTHLHFDHAGGITQLDSSRDPASARLTFPNARIFAQRREWDDALAGRSTMNKTYLPSHLGPDVRERLTLLEGDAPVMPGIDVITAPGHTWGQQLIRVQTDRGPVVFSSDVMPTALHCRATTNLAYDVEPYTSMIERHKMLDRAARERWTLVLDHEPGHPVFTVKPDEQGYFALHPAQLET